MIAPPEAVGTIKGLYYKLGRFGKAYYLNSAGEWIKSERCASEVQALIDRMDSRFSIDNDGPPKKPKLPKATIDFMGV